MWRCSKNSEAPKKGCRGVKRAASTGRRAKLRPHWADFPPSCSRRTGQLGRTGGKEKDAAYGGRGHCGGRKGPPKGETLTSFLHRLSSFSRSAQTARMETPSPAAFPGSSTSPPNHPLLPSQPGVPWGWTDPGASR